MGFKIDSLVYGLKNRSWNIKEYINIIKVVLKLVGEKGII